MDTIESCRSNIRDAHLRITELDKSIGNLKRKRNALQLEVGKATDWKVCFAKKQEVVSCDTEIHNLQNEVKEQHRLIKYHDLRLTILGGKSAFY